MQKPLETKKEPTRFSIRIPYDLASAVCKNADANERAYNREIIRMLKVVVKQENLIA